MSCGAAVANYTAVYTAVYTVYPVVYIVYNVVYTVVYIFTEKIPGRFLVFAFLYTAIFQKKILEKKIESFLKKADVQKCKD